MHPSGRASRPCRGRRGPSPDLVCEMNLVRGKGSPPLLSHLPALPLWQKAHPQLPTQLLGATREQGNICRESCLASGQGGPWKPSPAPRRGIPSVQRLNLAQELGVADPEVSRRGVSWALCSMTSYTLSKAPACPHPHPASCSSPRPPPAGGSVAPWLTGSPGQSCVGALPLPQDPSSVDIQTPARNQEGLNGTGRGREEEPWRSCSAETPDSSPKTHVVT